MQKMEAELRDTLSAASSRAFRRRPFGAGHRGAPPPRPPPLFPLGRHAAPAAGRLIARMRRLWSISGNRAPAALSLSACVPEVATRGVAATAERQVAPAPEPSPREPRLCPLLPRHRGAAGVARHAQDRRRPGRRAVLRGDSLAANFERIALYDEYALAGRAVRAGSRRRPRLRRWETARCGSSRIFGASVSDAQQAEDRLDPVPPYAHSGFARATGHPISTVRTGGNFHVLYLDRDDQPERRRYGAPGWFPARARR